MDGTFNTILAVLGLAIPTVAAVWEFSLVGRKRLGYRVQMDTRVRMDAVARGVEGNENAATFFREAGVLRELQDRGETLNDPSFVLLRFQNSGWTQIDSNDYSKLDEDPVGIRVEFPGRRIVGMAVTDVSHSHMGDNFRNAVGLRRTDDHLTLPRIPLNRGAHYKVLAVLDRKPDHTEEKFPDPVVHAGIKGGVRGGGIRRTEGHAFASRPVAVFMALVVALVATQSVATFTADEPVAAPLDCATGTLHLSGSTAFAPVVREAARQYEETCPEARIPLGDNTFKGSGSGLEALDDAGEAVGPELGEQGLGSHLTFHDGPKSKGHPRLLPRPVALSLFTVVVNNEAGVQDLSTEEIRDIFAGRITNWSAVHGNDVPIRLIGRGAGSGTRTTLVDQVLGGEQPAGVSVNDCNALPQAAPGRCEATDASTLLELVQETSGAIGYSEVGIAQNRPSLIRLRIDGYEATVEGADEGSYPYWQTENAYTYGEPPADSLAAGFLRYLDNEVGEDILRAHGHRPCSELAKRLDCKPS